MALAVTVLSSFSAQAGDWPTNADEALKKEKISFKKMTQVGSRTQMNEVTLDLKVKKYLAYQRGGNYQLVCKRASLSELTKLSDFEVEINSPKEGWCEAKVITINLKAKSIVFLEYDSDRANVKETYTADTADFE